MSTPSDDMTTMIPGTRALDIEICMGSSCYARGNDCNLEAIRAYIAERDLVARVRLRGCLCTGDCRNGPNLTINGVPYRCRDPRTVLDVLERLVE